jgi:hypothetical protein
MTQSNLVLLGKNEQAASDKFNTVYSLYLEARSAWLRPDFNASNEELQARADRWEQTTGS